MPSNSIDWGYDDDQIGPDRWIQEFGGGGKRQSPIDIVFDPCKLMSLTSLDYATTTNCEKNNDKNQIDNDKDNDNDNNCQIENINKKCNGNDDQRRQDSCQDAACLRKKIARTLTLTDTNTITKTICFNNNNKHESKENETGNGNGNGNQNSNEKLLSYSQLNSNNDNNKGNNNKNVRYHTSNKKIFLGYPRCLNQLRVCNNGHAWQVDIPPEIGAHTLLCGPPLGDRQYRLAQFHCHWGSIFNNVSNDDHDDDNSNKIINNNKKIVQGSEHTLNGRSFDGELHFVHWNCTQFDSFEQAAKHRHGLAVVGVFLQALNGEQNRNKYLDKIIGNLDDIYDGGSGATAPVADHVDLKLLFPTNRWTYASYEGSLTTPPLSEVIDWIVFFQPITCSTSQIEKFRKLKCGDKRLLTHNCRPVQPLNDRIINIWTHHHNNHMNHHHHHHHHHQNY